MEQWWNDIGMGKPKYLEKNLSQCYFVHHKSDLERRVLATAVVLPASLGSFCLLKNNYCCQLPILVQTT
jgi:hypothetical protein